MGTTRNQKKLFFNLRKAKSKIAALQEGDLRPVRSRLSASARRHRAGRGRDEPPLGGDASLNAPIAEDGDSRRWQDWLADDSESQETVMDRARGARQSPQGAVVGARVLNERDRRIFERGRLADHPVRLEELGRGVRSPGERVRQSRCAPSDKCRRRAALITTSEQPEAIAAY